MHGKFYSLVCNVVRQRKGPGGENAPPVPGIKKCLDAHRYVYATKSVQIIDVIKERDMSLFEKKNVVTQTTLNTNYFLLKDKDRKENANAISFYFWLKQKDLNGRF